MMKGKLLIVCFGYMLFGAATTTLFAREIAALGIYRMIIYIPAMAFFIFTVIGPLEKIKEFLKGNNQQTPPGSVTGKRMTKECFYPKPFNRKSEVVRWFYSRNNGCQVFFACSKEVSNKIEADSWADVSNEFTVYVEHQLMPFAVENTDWDKCYRYGIEYTKKVMKKDRDNCPDTGCAGTSCHCEPFGEGDFTYGLADAEETKKYYNSINTHK